MIGKLKSPTFLFDLDVASTHPQYGNLFMRMDNVILTDDDSIVSQGDVRYPLTSLLVFAEEGADLTALKRKLADYGVPFDFQEPTAVQCEGNDFETTAPAPTMAYSPISSWLIILAPVPT